MKTTGFRKSRRSGMTLTETLTAGMVTAVVAVIGVNGLIGGLKLNSRTVKANSSLSSTRSGIDLLTQDISFSDTCLSKFSAGTQTFNADMTTTLILHQPVSAGGVVLANQAQVVVYQLAPNTGTSGPNTLRRYTCAVNNGTAGALVNTGDVSVNDYAATFAYFRSDQLTGDGTSKTFALSTSPLNASGTAIFDLYVGAQQVRAAQFGQLGDLDVSLGSAPGSIVVRDSDADNGVATGKDDGSKSGKSDTGSSSSSSNGSKSSSTAASVAASVAALVTAILSALGVLNSSPTQVVQDAAAAAASMSASVTGSNLKFTAPPAKGALIDINYPLDPRTANLPANGLKVSYVVVTLRAKPNNAASAAADSTCTLTTRALLRNRVH